MFCFSVSVDVYEQLLSMGFPSGASAEALRQSNNNITTSLQVNSLRLSLQSSTSQQATSMSGFILSG